MAIWWQWLIRKDVACHIGDRMVLLGDHTKTPKDGRKMPAATTLHQDSETGSKPSYFRGHHWGCIGILMQACDKYFAVPLWANIQEGLALFTKSGNSKPLSKTIQIVEMAKQVALAMGTPAYPVLDAYFAAGPVFLAAAQKLNGMKNFIHILTRAKKNVVAYRDPPKKKKDQKQSSSNLIQTQNTLAAIEKFVNVQLLVLGMLQLIAKQFPKQVKNKANGWLRTVSSNTPSEFVTRTALANILKNNLYGFAKDWITQLIRQKQKSHKNKGRNKKVA